ncbi:hypothetical protein HDV06_004243 [Boothiomyces sp. JEL0866]|nr:hypothetical protein HDV06_004243 [Boothiomyces sp. JEL0866]
MLLLKKQELEDYLKTKSKVELLDEFGKHISLIGTVAPNSYTYKYPPDEGLDFKVINTTPSQHAHFTMCAKIIVALQLGMSEICKLCPKDLTAPLLLAIQDQGIVALNPVLFYTRYNLRQLMDQCLVQMDGEIQYLLNFLEDCLEVLMQTNVPEEYLKYSNATCVCLAAELGKFYFVVEDYTKSKEKLEFAMTMAKAFNIELPNHIVDFTAKQVENMLKVCKLNGTIFNDPLTAIVADLLPNKYPLEAKRLIKYTADIQEKAEESVFIACCNSITRSLKIFEIGQSLSNKDLMEIYLEVKKELPPVTAENVKTFIMILKLALTDFTNGKYEPQPSIELLHVWKHLFQTILLGLSFIVDLSGLGDDEFISSYFADHKIDKKLVEIDRLERKSPSGKQVAIREILMTYISTKEESKVAELKNIVGLHPLMIIKELLELVETLQERKSYNHALVLASQIEQFCPPEFSQRLFDAKNNCMIAQIILTLNENKVNVEEISKQLLENLKKLPNQNLGQCSSIITTLLSRNHTELALQYIQNLQLLENKNLFNFGRICLLIMAMWDNLKKVENINSLPLNTCQEVVDFAYQVTLWLCEPDSEILNVQQLVVDFICKRDTNMFKLMIGCCGGYVKPAIPIALLGHYSVFSVSSKQYWQSLDINLPPLNFSKVKPMQAESITNFMISAAEAMIKTSTKNDVSMYFLLAHLQSGLKQHREAVISIINGILVETNYFQKKKFYMQFYTSPNLGLLIKELLAVEDYFSALFFMQGQERDASLYAEMFKLVKKIPISSFNANQSVDPPTNLTEASMLYALYDVHLIEHFVTLFKREGMMDHVELLVNRLKSVVFVPGFEGFKFYVDKLNIWYISTLIDKYQK